MLGLNEVPEMQLFANERDLVAGAIALGADLVQPWSAAEVALAAGARKSALSKTQITLLRDAIRNGLDPLGEAFCTIRDAAERRSTGATYTPDAIVRVMVEWAAGRCTPQRIVDPGTGSARFLLRAAAAFPQAALVGIDSDPVAALIARANLAAAGLAKRSSIVVADYRTFNEPNSDGSTLFIGNPPYVRHHRIPANWKQWLTEQAGKLGYKASQLAGLHVHFFLTTLLKAKPGDCGTFVTAAEWLDVNYGSLLRSLVARELGGRSITLLEPTAQPFPDAATTAVITTFEVASKPKSVFFQRVRALDELVSLESGQRVPHAELIANARWSVLSRPVRKAPSEYVALGDLCRVHRGQVTGANSIWIAGAHSRELPASVLYPTVTRARELIAADGVLQDTSKLRCVIDLPTNLDQLAPSERRAVNRFLSSARRQGADKGYVASHRKAWWSVGLRSPAPIISTYMARRAPAFVRNEAGARHINIAHGLYPRGPLSDVATATLLRFLQTEVSECAGRTYSGGLTKFEPREMERLRVPSPEMLEAGVFSL